MPFIRKPKLDAPKGVVDLFNESDITRQFIKEKIDDIVAELSGQFKEPEDCYRELIQNSIDSETKQIDISFDVKKLNNTHSRFSVIFEDYGCGMSLYDKEEFFLKLFKSKKENDIKKIGKYGIGISSIFQLGLEEVVIESTGISDKTKEVESWGRHIKDISSLPSNANYDIEPRKGTKIAITRIVDNKDLKRHKDKVFEKVSYYCERSRTPIYIDGDYINKEFDLESHIKISHSKNGLEYVLSVGEMKGNFFELFNNRLKLDEGKGLLGEGIPISCIVSSPYFKHTFSRDAVEHDHYFTEILQKLSQAQSSLFVKCLEMIDYYNNTPPLENEISKPSFELIHASHNFKKVTDAHSLEKILNKISAIKEGEENIFYNDIESLEKELKEFKKDLDNYTFEKKQSRFLSKKPEPSIKVEYKSHFVETIDSKYSIGRVEDMVANAKGEGINMLGEEISSVEKKIQQFKDQLISRKNRDEEIKNENQKKDHELGKAWEFVNQYMADLISNIKAKRSSHLSIIGKIKKLNYPSSLYEHIKKSLPPQVSNYKIINSLTHGQFSINEILDNFIKDPHIYFVNSRHTGLDDLLKGDGKIVFLDKNSHSPSNDELSFSQKKLVGYLVAKSYGELNKSFINASQVYALSLRMDDAKIDERYQSFLNLVKKNLPIRIKEWTNELYFTTDKISPNNASVIFINSSGKIELGNRKEKKQSLWSKLTSTPNYGKYDIIFNIDNLSNQKLISLTTYGGNFSQNIAMSSLISQIEDKFPIKSAVKQQSYRPYGGNNLKLHIHPKNTGYR
jgi:hypothetical protein